MNETTESLIPIAIRNPMYPDGKRRIRLGVPMEYTSVDMQERTNKIRETFLEFVRTFKEQKEEYEKSKNIKDHWDLGDVIYKFSKWLKSKGFYLSEDDTTLENIECKWYYWKIWTGLRKYYPQKRMLTKDIDYYGWVQLALTESNKIREILEPRVRSGELKTEQAIYMEELRLSGKKKEMSPCHKKILTILSNDNLTQNEIAEKTGLQPDSIRGRISNLRHYFGYNISIDEKGKYHLDKL